MDESGEDLSGESGQDNRYAISNKFVDIEADEDDEIEDDDESGEMEESGEADSQDQDLLGAGDSSDNSED